ncbi:class I SAM-dependent methyltransferase [Lacihabitans sp. LS3-19]|uniref:class I SAM-dependent methyltransferase n=1 Tax=Lacihabitans sp. LS3-19 TaxID=2487335 RepID=UPI0020CF5B8F|nr:class I SAM-dependent methyltransferase [Lacihabitans sp. LS3-19]MCP9770913.1 class I SAM-dependent methyltransferase [Lacihabitans sp. LS3-19]
MLLNSEEYAAMFNVEENLWWYKILHERVLIEVNAFAKNDKSIKILDAGCGTGGLMLKLKNQGFESVCGFDFNDDAVEFSNSRNLDVTKKDITDLNGAYPIASFDIIISDDVLYQFDDITIQETISGIGKFLKPGGIFITNNQAFPIFSGTHDIAVGAKKRFVLSDFQGYLKESPDLKIAKSTYWSLMLSPLILAVRLIQKIKLKMGLVNMDNIKSDVAMPSNFINQIFFSICNLERKILPKSPFGSSLFLVIKKEK